MSNKNDLFEILIKRIDKLSNSLDNLINIQLSKELKNKNILEEDDDDDNRKRKRRKLNNNTYQEIKELKDLKEINIPENKNSVILDNLEQINKTLKTLSIGSSKLSDNNHHNNHQSLVDKYKEQDIKDHHSDMRYLYIN